MRTIATREGKFSFYESIKELPIDRYCEFQKYLLQDSGIGSDIESVYRHFEKIDVFIASNKLPEVAIERTNQHFNFFFMLNQINITHLSFAILVASVDEQSITDHSESALIELCKRLGSIGLTHMELNTYLEEVKKKLIPN